MANPEFPNELERSLQKPTKLEEISTQHPIRRVNPQRTMSDYGDRETNHGWDGSGGGGRWIWHSCLGRLRYEWVSSLGWSRGGGTFRGLGLVESFSRSGGRDGGGTLRGRGGGGGGGDHRGGHFDNSGAGGGLRGAGYGRRDFGQSTSSMRGRCSTHPVFSTASFI